MIFLKALNKAILGFLRATHLTSRDGGNAQGLPGAILVLYRWIV